MKKEYLSEAFRQLELLNEEDFNLSTTADNSDLKDFLDNDDMSVMSLDVIDPEAETEEDLEDSYTGKVILDCCVCHSKLYKDKEEVQIDEEQDLANTDEECPFCYSRDGFKIIGEVAPYGETEVEPEVEEEPEDIEHEEDEDFDESLKSRKNRKLKESYEKEGYYAKVVHDTLIKVGVDYIDIGADQEGDSIIVRVYNETPYTSNDLRKVWLKLHTPEAEGCDISEDEDGDSVMIFEFSLEDEDDDDFEESLKSRKTRKTRKLKESLRGVDAELIADEDDIRDYLSDDDDEDLRIALKHLGDMGTVIDDSIHVTVKFSDGDRITLPKMFFEFDMDESLKTRKNRRLKEDWSRGVILTFNCTTNSVKNAVEKGLISIPAVEENGFENIIGSSSLKVNLGNDNLFSFLNVHEDVCEFWFTAYDNDIKYWLDGGFTTLNRIVKTQQLDYSLESLINELYDSLVDSSCEVVDMTARIVTSNGEYQFTRDNFNESLKSRKNKSVNEAEDGRKLFTEYKILVDGRTYEISHTKQRADEIVPILKDMYPDSEIEAKPYKHYASGIERKRLERQIADQLKEYGVNESVNESIQEIEIETDTDKIKIESEPKEESGEDILAPVSPETEQQIENNSSDEIDVPIDEFDEETFDELGESFLKNTYENVKSYKTESIKEQDGNKLVVEGLITFSSGKVKKTSFIFEAKDITKSGKVRFIGENCQLSRGKKSFTVAGKIQEGKFISESLNYNYRAKDAKSGKSTRMYGTVRTNK